jgi:hypothetical protein
MEARNMATSQMQSDPKYQHLKYGQADYFVQFEELVRQNIEMLTKFRGCPKQQLDGSTGLPVLSYQENLGLNI